MHPDRIVIGSFDPADGDTVERLHEGIDAPFVRSDVASAEMIKLAANAALVTRISFINEIANVCEATGPTSSQSPRESGSITGSVPRSCGRASASAARASRRTRCALKQLAANSGVQLPAPERGDRGQRAPEAPGGRQARTAARLTSRKEDRASRARVQARHGRPARGAEPRPRGSSAGRGRRGHRMGSGRRRCRSARRRRDRGSALDALAGADAAPIVTEWPELRELDSGRAGARMRNRLVIDGRNLLDPVAPARDRLRIRGHRTRRP